MVSQADRRQSAARRAARADPGQDRRGAAVRGGADQVHSRIGRAEGRRRSLRLRRRRPQHHHPGHAARLADGAAGSVHAGQGDRADRRGDRAGVQLRADRGRRADDPEPSSTTRSTQLTDSGLAFRRGTPPEATYTFKHALVQDAAYDSLLKSRRQELHAKIARVIEERFPADQRHRARAAGASLHAGGAAPARRSRSGRRPASWRSSAWR